MFNTERFIQDCRNALAEDNAHGAVKEIVTRAVAEPSRVLQELGEPGLAGVKTIYRSGNLTILNVLWGPCMYWLPPRSSDVGGDRYLWRTGRQCVLPSE